MLAARKRVRFNLRHTSIFFALSLKVNVWYEAFVTNEVTWLYSYGVKDVACYFDRPWLYYAVSLG